MNLLQIHSKSICDWEGFSGSKVFSKDWIAGEHNRLKAVLSPQVDDFQTFLRVWIWMIEFCQDWGELHCEIRAGGDRVNFSNVTGIEIFMRLEIVQIQHKMRIMKCSIKAWYYFYVHQKFIDCRPAFIIF